MQNIIPVEGASELPPVKKHCTYADYLKLDDANRYELIEGELAVTPSPGLKHQHVTDNLATEIKSFVLENGAGIVIQSPFDVVLAEGVVLQPDVLFVSRERYHLFTRSCLHGAPDLVVEVISPSTGGRDRIKKSRLYRRYGVLELWLIDPEARTAEVLTNGEKGWYQAGAYDDEDFLTSPILPGLQINLNEVFTMPEGISL